MLGFQVVPERLAEASSRYRATAEILQEVVATAGSEAGLADACGASTLVDAAARFQDRWARTIAALATDHQDVAVRLASAAQTYATTDHALVPAVSPMPSGLRALYTPTQLQPSPQPSPQPSHRPAPSR